MEPATCNLQPATSCAPVQQSCLRGIYLLLKGQGQGPRAGKKSKRAWAKARENKTSFGIADATCVRVHPMGQMCNKRTRPQELVMLSLEDVGEEAGRAEKRSLA